MSVRVAYMPGGGQGGGEGGRGGGVAALSAHKRLDISVKQLQAKRWWVRRSCRRCCCPRLPGYAVPRHALPAQRDSASSAKRQLTASRSPDQCSAATQQRLLCALAMAACVCFAHARALCVCSCLALAQAFAALSVSHTNFAGGSTRILRPLAAASCLCKHVRP